VLAIGCHNTYIVMIVHWCNIVVLNVHTPSEEKSYDSNDSLYEELEQVLYIFSKYHIQI
jgi:hypothetical protein